MGLGTRLAELLVANKSIAIVTSGDLRDTQDKYPNNYINLCNKKYYVMTSSILLEFIT